MRALVSALIVIGVAACGKPKAERHGEVVAVTGEVTVERPDAKPEPLAVGDRVKGTDRIRTGEGAEVRIKLAHNGVTLIYGGGVDVVLAKAPGWSASGDVSAGALDPDPNDKTSAAGVNSEKEAATDPNAVMADDADNTTRADGETASTEVEGTETQRELRQQGDDNNKGKGGSSTSAKGAPNVGAGAGPEDDSDGEPPRDKDRAPRLTLEGGSAQVREVVRRLLLARLPAMDRCVGDHEYTVRVKLAVAGGKLLTLSVDGGHGAARSCITGVLRAVSVPKDLPATKDLRATIAF